MTIQMFDTVDVATMPDNPEAVAGYVNGKWPTFSDLVRKYPKAYHLSIAVNTSANADCLDVEPFDATPADAPAWVRTQLARGVKRPVVYASVSTMSEVLSILNSAGIHRASVRLWTAHYTYKPHICTPTCGFGFDSTADATQWTDKSMNRNLDESLCVDSFFKRVFVDPNHYDWFATGPFYMDGKKLYERVIVKEYDRLRQHPFIHRPRLKKLRDELGLLAGRVLTVAHEQHVNGKPSWVLWHRGWRYQQLIHRAQGKRLA